VCSLTPRAVDLALALTVPDDAFQRTELLITQGCIYRAVAPCFLLCARAYPVRGVVAFWRHSRFSGLCHTCLVWGGRSEDECIRQFVESKQISSTPRTTAEKTGVSE